MLRILKNSRGFSMVQGLIISAVLASSGLVITRMLGDQKMAQKGAETRSQIEQLHSIIYSTLQNRQHCSLTYTNEGGPLSPAASGTLNISNIRVAPSNTAIFSVNTGGSLDTSRTYMNNTVMINSMVLRHNADLGVASKLEIDYTRLETDPNKRTGSGYGGKKIRKTIDIAMQRIPASLAGAGNFIACYAVDSNISTGNENLSKYFCQGFVNTSSGAGTTFFQWDESTNTCLLRDNTCPSGTFFVGIGTDGVRQCQTFYNWADMSQLIETETVENCNLGDGGSSVCLRVNGDRVKLHCDC